MNDKTYLLNVGSADRERLDILSDIYAAGSKHFFLQNLPPHARSILDIGCGHGHMTRIFAQAVQSNNGQATGIDISPEQIAACEALRIEQGTTNVHYLVRDISVGQPFDEQFDLVYCRFLLMHLKEWDRVFENMLSACRDGGSIIIEEPGLPFFSFPERASAARANAFAMLLDERAGLHFDCAAPLWAHIQKYPLDVESVQFNQPALLTARHKSLYWRTLIQLKEPLIAMQIASQDEIEDVIADLQLMANQENYLAGGLRVLQLHLKKRGTARTLR